MRNFLWICVMLIAAGCASKTGDNGYPADGRAVDGKSKEVIKPRVSWEQQCWLPSQEAISKQLKNPKTAKFDSFPSYEAYYDRDRDVTIFVMSGIVDSAGNYGQRYAQNYYASWEHPGYPGRNLVESEPWTPASAIVFDAPN